MLSLFICPVLVVHVVCPPCGFFSSVPLYSGLVGLSKAAIGSILTIPALLNLSEIQREQQRVEKSGTMIRQLSLAERLWIDDGPLRKKMIYFPCCHYHHITCIYRAGGTAEDLNPQGPPSPLLAPAPRDQSLLHMLIIMPFQLKHDLNGVIMDLCVEEVFQRGVDTPRAQKGLTDDLPKCLLITEISKDTPRKVFPARLGEPIPRF